MTTMPALLLGLWLFAGVASAADPPREVHGSADAYATPGVALAWGVLRGANEAATTVVVRVVTDPKTYPWLAVAGIDPFTKVEQPLQRATASGGSLDVGDREPGVLLRIGDDAHHDHRGRLVRAAQNTPGEGNAGCRVHIRAAMHVARRVGGGCCTGQDHQSQQQRTRDHSVAFSGSTVTASSATSNCTAAPSAAISPGRAL